MGDEIAPRLKIPPGFKDCPQRPDDGRVAERNGREILKVEKRADQITHDVRAEGAGNEIISPKRSRQRETVTHKGGAWSSDQSRASRQAGEAAAPCRVFLGDECAEVFHFDVLADARGHATRKSKDLRRCATQPERLDAIVRFPCLLLALLGLVI